MSSSATPAVGTGIDVHNLFGPILIGVFFNMILYGLLITQVTTYFQAQRKDPLWIRILVFYVIFVETSNTALDISVMYQPLILEYGTLPGKLPTGESTLLIRMYAFTDSLFPGSLFDSTSLYWGKALVQFPIELFLIWRIRTLTESMIIPAIFVALSVVAFGGGIWTTVALAGAGRWDNVSASFHAATLWISTSMATDLCIAFCLAWVLASGMIIRKRKTGFGATDTVVDRIIRMTVQTGLVTAVCNVLDLLSFLLIKNSTLNFMWSNPLSKLYSNCMMSTLNARTNLEQSLPTHISSSGPTHGNAGVVIPLQAKARNDLAGKVGDREYGIHVDQTVDAF
ncbi:hypothetical protein B0H16DRAFT_1711266 [Mycena metata]|uniref:DUF6534 domain-containing protein n=1 Tax=Mycena metata TaxID=1033252 RepID=A0AAD7K8B4_9AGAR|nr:hypothetical protein B0H16DRAFT_1711266 [Mycena metata]